MTATTFDKVRVEKIYSFWAPVYDLVFGAVFEQGRRSVVAAVERVGGRILEVGVGTGISLPYYSRASRVFGIDLSQEMLSKARERVSALNLAHVEGLAVMDAATPLIHTESLHVAPPEYPPGPPEDPAAGV